MEKLKLSFFLALICFANFSAKAQTFSGGTGTADDPYLLSTPADLLEL